MIGRLILSDRNIFKIKIGQKYIQARKCNILSITHKDILIKTSKEFNVNDDYVYIDPISNTIVKGLGKVGNFENDLGIYSNIFMLGWIPQSKYSKLFESIYISNNCEIQKQFDLAINLGFERIEYSHNVITIDPEGSVDLDDGFSFWWDEFNYYLDIHIADPVSRLNPFENDFIPILKELYKRIQTCYIGTKPTHLFPDSFVKIVSLLESEKNSQKRAVSFCFVIPIESPNIHNVEFKIKFTNLTNIKNYTYEKYENFLNSSEGVDKKIKLIDIANKLINITGINFKSIDVDINAENEITHKIIEIFMITSNWFGGNFLVSTQPNFNTVIRVQDPNDLDDLDNVEKDFDIESIPEYAIRVLANGANYICSNQNSNFENSNFHQTLGIRNYAHLSSPMRRFIDIIGHFGIYRIDLIKRFESICGEKFLLSDLNQKVKNYKKISNAYELIKFIGSNANTNIFKACLINLKNQETINNSNNIYCTLALFQSEYNFVRMVNVELPQIMSNSNLKRFMEFDIELYYNSNNFKSNKFPFSVKII